jgi:hypothetical protein
LRYLQESKVIGKDRGEGERGMKWDVPRGCKALEMPGGVKRLTWRGTVWIGERMA